VRFLVDTGATVIALPSGEAKRLGVDYEKGQKVLMRTANGTGSGYLVKLDAVAVGGVTLYGVEAVRKSSSASSSSSPARSTSASSSATSSGPTCIIRWSCSPRSS
jgi:clan AA aspartic protease (TIGR02281 family)